MVVVYTCLFVIGQVTLVERVHTHKLEALGNYVEWLVQSFSHHCHLVGPNLNCNKSIKQDNRGATLLMIPPLSATPSAPTITRSTCSIMKLNKQVKIRDDKVKVMYYCIHNYTYTQLLSPV